MRVVLDTNVLVSAIIERRGKPNQIVSLAGIWFEWLTSEFILSEWVEVINRKHIQTKYKKWVTSERQAEFLETAGILAEVVQTHIKLDIVADPKDNHILACAIDGQADYLVTGDPHLLSLSTFEGILIVTPDQFLKALGPRPA